jgi:two-component system chemotaxis response regulator CheY
MRILIAEDQTVMAMLLRRELERAGHQVRVVADGLAAWQVIEEGGASVLISDWEMPGLDGPELCRRIRASGSAHYIYIILLTAKAGRGHRILGLKAGADDFLTKPVDPEELAVRLEVAARILGVHQQLAARNAELAALAITDGLTGLANRRRFDEELARHVTLADRVGAPLAVLLADLDLFKAYNDEFGHPAGDEALRTVAKVIKSCVRDCDIAARYGGEEFAVILPGAGLASARDVAERIRESVAARLWPLRQVTLSMGVAASTPSEIVKPTALLTQADEALYASKRGGRDRVTAAGLVRSSS